MSQMNKNTKAGFQITNSQTRDVEEKKVDLPAVDNTESRWFSVQCLKKQTRSQTEVIYLVCGFNYLLLNNFKFKKNS